MQARSSFFASCAVEVATAASVFVAAAAVVEVRRLVVVVVTVMASPLHIEDEKKCEKMRKI